MQEIESTKIDLQPLQKQESNLDSNLNGQINQQASTAATINNSQSSQNSKKTNNLFQASLERQHLLLNMEQQLIYPTTQMLATNLTPNIDTILEDVKVMDIQVDSNNNMPGLFHFQGNRQTGTLPSINELRNNQRNSQFNSDNLLVDDKKSLRTNLILNQFSNQNSSQSNGQFNQFNTTDDNEFNHFDDDYSRLSHTQTSIYDNFELNQTIKMEEDFQDDKLDFKTGPTLAELNLNDDDMMDNLPTVNPNSILCPSTPLLPNKNGFLMGCNYTNNLATTLALSNSITTQTTDSHNNLANKDLVLSANNDQFSLNNQFDLNPSSFNQSNSHNRNNHQTNSTNDSSTINKNYQSLSTNANQSNKSASYNTRTRGRQKSSSDKQSKRSNQQQKQQQQQQQNLSQTNQVLCKLLNEKNDNLNKFPALITNEPSLNQATNSLTSIGQLPSTSSTTLINSNNTQFQTICVSSCINLNTNKSVSTQSSLNNLPSDLLLNQLQQTKCGLQAANPNNNLRINNSANRNRNSSISTEHSFSSHDEGKN